MVYLGTNFFTQIKFTNHMLMGWLDSGNIILGVLSVSGVFGVLACALLWLPTYIFSIIKANAKS